ncbi:holin family protein [Shimia sp.]|uniref:holin family protein n=1 Tax=Shimia sp. TaxID=1954381 RepID=UPI00356473EF
MGLIGKLFSLVFGDGRNLVAETVGVFRENAEAGAERSSNIQMAAMAAHGAEFYPAGRGLFDRLMDAVNRLPRPMMALACLGLMGSAMVDPVWFAARMAGIALVPEPLWWLLGIVVSFYFGARHQAKGQEFQQSIAASIARVPQVVETIRSLEQLPPRAEGHAVNAALEDWRRQDARQEERQGGRPGAGPGQ